MKAKKFSIADKDPKIVALVEKADHKIIAKWVVDCVERVLPYFEEKYPEDSRPRNAMLELKAWVMTGSFKMAVIRKASLDAHAAARAVGEDSPARSAARAVGQAVATAHVRTHAIAAANYSLQAISRATDSSDVEAAIEKEKKWQYHRLLVLTL